MQKYGACLQAELMLQSIYWSERTGCDLLLEIARPVVNKTYLVCDLDCAYTQIGPFLRSIQSFSRKVVCSVLLVGSCPRQDSFFVLS